VPELGCPHRQLRAAGQDHVMNNGYLGMVRQWQELFYNNRMSAVTLDCFPTPRNWPRLLMVSQGTVPEKLWEPLRGGTQRGCRRARSVPAERESFPFECVYPMVPAGGAINEMVLGLPQPVVFK